MSSSFFSDIDEIPFVGRDADPDALGFRVYEPDRMVLGKRMEDHLRFSACYWHTFCWPGDDVFGDGTFDRPWQASGGDPMALAHTKLSASGWYRRSTCPARKYCWLMADQRA